MRTKLVISYDSESKDEAFIMFEGELEKLASIFEDVIKRNPSLGVAILTATARITIGTIKAAQELNDLKTVIEGDKKLEAKIKN